MSRHPSRARGHPHPHPAHCLSRPQPRIRRVGSGLGLCAAEADHPCSHITHHPPPPAAHHRQHCICPRSVTIDVPLCPSPPPPSTSTSTSRALHCIASLRRVARSPDAHCCVCVRLLTCNDGDGTRAHPSLAQSLAVPPPVHITPEHPARQQLAGLPCCTVPPPPPQRALIGRGRPQAHTRLSRFRRQLPALTTARPRVPQSPVSSPSLFGDLPSRLHCLSSDFTSSVGTSFVHCFTDTAGPSCPVSIATSVLLLLLHSSTLHE